MALIHDRVDEAHVLHVFGEVDLSTSAEFEAEVLSMDDAPRLVIDMLECKYADSSVLAVLVRANKLFASRLVVVAAERGPIRRLLNVTGLEALLSVEPTLEIACSA